MENNTVKEMRSGVIIFTIICNLALLLFAIYLWIEEDGIGKQEFLTFSGLTILPILNIFVLSRYTNKSIKNLPGVIGHCLKQISKTLDTFITTHINANINLKGIFVGLGIYAVFYLVFWNILSSPIAHKLIANSPLATILGVGSLIFYFLMQVVCGFVAGRAAKSSGWLNGMIVGIGVPVISAIVRDTFPGYELVYIPPSSFFSRELVYALICCSAGGFVADFMRRNT